MSSLRPVLSQVRRRGLIGGLAALALLGLPATANAGRLIVTGHDADSHCTYEGGGSCRFLSVGVNYVRGGAPDVTKPVLLLDRGPLALRAAIRRSYPADAQVPFQVVDPRSPEFASLPLTTNAYSAIIVASSKDLAGDPNPSGLNEEGSTPDTDAINARAADIAAFFDAGGGIFVNSGGSAARANSAAYYRFVNVTRGGGAVRAPLSLTPLGRSLGWQDRRVNPAESNDINCCLTHNSFDLPAPESPLKVAEQDKDGRAVTLVAESAKLATIEEPLVNPGEVFAPIQGGSTGATTGGTGTGTGTTPRKPVCVPRRYLRVTLRRPSGVRFSSITVYVNGKRVKKVSGRRLGSGRRTKAFVVRLARNRVSRVRILALTTSGRKYTLRQNYNTRCR